VAIGLVAAWSFAARGAEPPAAAPPDIASYDSLITAADREHWSFQPVRSVAAPDVRDRAWVRNPIDQFVLTKLEAKGWRPSRPAEPHAILRRAHLDLVGLPPTLVEQDAWRADSSPEALDRVIDNLLARPGYGERWGRHWLDLVRYAETNGYERDGMKPHVWRYRDYVIRSFNEDKPYDRFILEQLAGDELPDANSDTVIALGYYRLGPWDDEPADPVEDRFDQLDDIVSTTSQVFLGLTLGCARCHNHKFEPLTTLDYYRLVATFNTLQRSQAGRADLDAPAGTRVQRAAQAERDRRISELQKQIAWLREPVATDLLKSGRSKLPPEAVAAILVEPAKRNDAQKKLVTQHGKQFDQEVSVALSVETRARVAEIDSQVAALRTATPDLPRAYFSHEPSPTPPATHVLLRGKATRPGIAVGAGMPAVLVKQQPEFPSPGPQTSGRRITFARWIASRDNPLTARVIVNRVWQFHFGEGLVRTPSDFGVMGTPPTHPELLDWLAHWFIENGWSFKNLHRLILTSNTYRMSKAWNAEYGAADPENELLWRVPYRRLEVEAIRDSMLVVSGRLNSKMGGPSMFPFVPKDALAGHADRESIWPAYDEVEASRRTIYAHVKRSMIVPMLEVLDLCDTTKSSAKRSVTSVAPQALTLFNGHFVNQQAGHLATRLAAEAGSDSARQIDLAYRLALCRSPTDTERAAMLDFLRDEATRLPSDAKAAGQPLTDAAARQLALEQVCRVVFNLNEFAYSD
jgi:hypothetical protein